MKQSKELTKHLYRRDEVLSSLRWSIITFNIMETAFWAIEIYDSNLLEDGLEILESLWITTIGFGSWFALRLLCFIREQGEISKEEWADLCCALAKYRIRDSTIFHLLLRGSIQKDIPRFQHEKEYTSIQDAVKDCIQRGKICEAWLLGRSLSYSDQWSMLDSFNLKEELSLIKGFRESNTECLAIAYVLVSLDTITWLASQAPIVNSIPIEVTKAIDEWSHEKSMRKRRVYKVRPEALLYLTKRSEESSDIRVDFEDVLKSSEYWSEILVAYMKNGKWISDQKKEKFYDTFFPDDIPDEWSTTDQERSHGYGLAKTKEQARSRFIYHILQRSKSLELWDSSFPNDLDCSMDWDSLYSIKQVIEIPMKPVKKIFELV